MKGILITLLPIAVITGAVYFLFLKPASASVSAVSKTVEDITAPISAISDAANEAIKAVLETGETVSEALSDLSTGITSPSTFTRAPGTGGDFIEGFFSFGADIQRALTGGLTWREEAVLNQKTRIEALSSLMYDIDLVAPRPNANPEQVKQQNYLDKIFSDQNTARRLTNTISNTIQGNYSTIGGGKSLFGGYGSAVSQETELRKAIEESRASYPEAWAATFAGSEKPASDAPIILPQPFFPIPKPRDINVIQPSSRRGTYSGGRR